MRWVLRGIVINGFLKFLITQCAPKDEKDRTDWDEDDPAMSFADKQAVRVSKCQKALTESDFHAPWLILGSSHLSLGQSSDANYSVSMSLKILSLVFCN